jgi:hypothetical protein
MTQGDTFLLRNRNVDSHLWVVISDPDAYPDAVLVVNLTTYTFDHEGVCLISAGEHPWVRHKTCVAYEFARTLTRAQLQSLSSDNQLQKQASVSPELLQRIIHGASLSHRIKVELIEIMGDQGLLD